MSRELFSGAAPLLLFVAKATLLLVAALVGTMTLRRSTAGARHLVWLAALVGVLALPLLSRIPALQIGIVPLSVATSAELPRMAPLDAPVIAGVVAPNAPRSAPTSTASVAPSVVPSVVPAVATMVPSETSLPIDGAPSLLTTLAIVWTSVALSLLAWLAAGAVQVRRIVAGARELTSPDWSMPLCEVADRLDLETPPRLVISDRIEMAFACGAFTPTIVLPAAAEGWSDDRRRAVLFHELAHVKRHDLAGHLLGRVACALYWFHPLVWTAAKNLRNESERACDDLVLSCGARPSEYAQHLLDMVTSVRRHGAPVMALPMARKKEFEGRMLAILDPAIRRAAPGRWQSACVIATLAMLSLTVAAVAPARPARPAARAVQTPVAPVVRETAAHVATKAPKATATATPAAKSTAMVAVTAGQTAPVAQARASARVDGDTDFMTDAIGSAIRLGFAEAQKALNGALKDGRIRHVQQADTGRITLLIKVLTSDGDAVVRRTAAWALHDVRTPGARTTLVRALRSDADTDVRETSAWALAEYDDADVTSALANALTHDKSTRVRATSAWALGTIGGSTRTDALVAGASDADGKVRHTAIWALGQTDLHQAPAAVVKALADSSAEVRTVAAWTLGAIGDSSAVRALVKAFESETTSGVRMAELHAITSIGTAPSAVIDIAMKSSDPELRRRGVAMLAGTSQSWPWPWPWPWPRPFP